MCRWESGGVGEKEANVREQNGGKPPLDESEPRGGLGGCPTYLKAAIALVTRAVKIPIAGGGK